jgi:hypothetical protein
MPPHHIGHGPSTVKKITALAATALTTATQLSGTKALGA